MYQQLSWLFLILLSFFQAYLCFLSPVGTNSAAALSLFAVTLLLLLLPLLYRNFFRTNYWPTLVYAVMAAAFLIQSQYLVAAITILLYVLFKPVMKKKVVRISDTGIIYPSFPEKKISWQQISNLLLKDGLLTIDLKSNKLIQQYTEETGTDEKIFNEFCRQQLNQ